MFVGYLGLFAYWDSPDVQSGLKCMFANWLIENKSTRIMLDVESGFGSFPKSKSDHT